MVRRGATSSVQGTRNISRPDKVRWLASTFSLSAQTANWPSERTHQPSHRSVTRTIERLDATPLCTGMCSLDPALKMYLHRRCIAPEVWFLCRSIPQQAARCILPSRHSSAAVLCHWTVTFHPWPEAFHEGHESQVVRPRSPN